MIKKSIFEDELIAGMHKQLTKQAAQSDVDHLEKAADYLNSAAEIFEDLGMTKNADEVLSILSKIAQHIHDEPGSDGNDSHTKGLTPEKMTQNLTEHGIVFNIDDDESRRSFLDNMLDTDISDVLDVSDADQTTQDIHDFEDERD